MSDLIDKLSTNNYVIFSLSFLLIVLIALFIIVYFAGRGKKTKNENAVIDKTVNNSNISNDIDFDHGEYVKETTAEFELTPITDVKPIQDEFISSVKEEETPAIDINSKSVDEVPLADFNFDDLSKSISAELDKLKEDTKVDPNVIGTTANLNDTENNLPEVTFVDAFKEVDSNIKPVEIAKVEDFNQTGASQNQSEPTFITDFSSFEEIKPTSSESEPIKKDEVPIFASFNQETFDINKKD